MRKEVVAQLGITVFFYGSLHAYTKCEFAVDDQLVYPYRDREGLTVAEICRQIGLATKYVSPVLVNNQRSSIETPLQPRDEGKVFPKVIGGGKSVL